MHMDEKSTKERSWSISKEAESVKILYREDLEEFWADLREKMVKLKQHF